MMMMTMMKKNELERQLLERKEPEPGSRQPAPSALPTSWLRRLPISPRESPDSLVFRPYPYENYNPQKAARGGAVECSMMGVVV